MRHIISGLSALFACAMASFGLGPVSARAETQVARGAYLATIMDCGGCHTTGSLIGQPDPQKYLGGSDIGWLIPGLGIFYASNLTPDKETGIGSWSTTDIVKLLRTGVTPQGRVVAPMMPWRSYAKAKASDLEALALYLKTIPPVRHKILDPTSLEAVKTPYLTIAPPPK